LVFSYIEKVTFNLPPHFNLTTNFLLPLLTKGREKICGEVKKSGWEGGGRIDFQLSRFS